jgi:Las17-binding protein actin regulator
MIIQNEKGMQKLLSSNFRIGADASAAAGPVGRHASASTDWKLDTEIPTYSRAKGASTLRNFGGEKPGTRPLSVLDQLCSSYRAELAF